MKVNTLVLGENPYIDFSDEELKAEIDAWREVSDILDSTSKNWCIRFLNEVERRWRNQ